ncbi:MAG TPA: amidohydrolase [Candidatus Bathyarchaeia archaeon]|nr:amidohydrolase [Candidatus Bathyarchaeia archaeon]
MGPGDGIRLQPDVVFIDGRPVSDRVVAISGGRITAVEPAGLPAAADTAATDVLRLAGKALLPGTVNAHCHTFQSLLRGLGDDLDFMAWRDRVLYPYSTRLDRDGIYLGAAFAFAEMLLHGATTCVDFFYLQDGGNDNAEAVIRAARDVGIRLVLARTMYDWEGAPARYRESPADAARRVSELIAAHSGDPMVSVQPAPHSPHGASPAMIRAGWEVAESADTKFHIHVAEGQYEGQRTLAEHGATPIRLLDKWGVLGPRMIGVHCVWLDDDELRLMAERGAGLAYCPSSNMILGDGITRITEMTALGIRIGLGTDGGCTNNRLSVFEEMRMASLLQKVRHLDGTRLPAEQAFRMGTAGGARLLGLEAGDVEPGRLADLVAIDLGHPSLHPRTNLLKNVVYAMSPQAVTDVWVHGRAVVRDRRLASVDQAALMARVRALTADWRPA